MSDTTKKPKKNGRSKGGAMRNGRKNSAKHIAGLKGELNVPGGKKSSKTGKSKSRPTEKRGANLGLVVFVLSFAVLSALAGIDFKSPPNVYVAGEIAGAEVAADQDLLIEDTASTLRKRKTVAEAQPPVFDLSMEPLERLDDRVREVFDTLNSSTKEELEDVRWLIAEDLNSEIDEVTFTRWTWQEFQDLFFANVLPWLQTYMSAGVVASRDQLRIGKTGFIVRDIATAEEYVRGDVTGAPDLEQMIVDLDNMLRNDLRKPLAMRKAVVNLVEPIIDPSLTFNADETRQRRNDVTAAVEPVFYRIQKGEVIVRKGEPVSVDQQLKLQALFSKSGGHFKFNKAVGIFLVGMVFIGCLSLASRAGQAPKLADRDYFFLAATALVFGAVAKVLGVTIIPLAEAAGIESEAVIAYGLPLAGMGGLIALFHPFSICCFMALLASFVSAEMLQGGEGLLVYLFLGAMLYAFLIKRADNRIKLLKSVFPLAGALLLAWAGEAFMLESGPMEMGVGATCVVGASLMSLLIVLALGHIAEYVFGYTSRFKLMELMNLEQPLLQELMVKAPGTYHHSLILSNLVEAGARSVGANALLAKVAALYHDIGKLKNPHYFIENQIGRDNKHDKLSPSMSALILISHVKKGVELAEEHKLGSEIIDLIRQHHGTGLISYFYHKAGKQAEMKGGDAVCKEDYSYPGPKPQTKEAGLIMLADAVEASSRTLVDPTPARIKGHIDNIFKKIFSEGQLDESDLTFKDLHRLSETFNRILNGIFHHRIEYPDGKKPQAQQGKDKAAERQSGTDAAAQRRHDNKAADRAVSNVLHINRSGLGRP